ncbi:patatin-like phospholipase family protein [Chitinimonas sp. BJB300]|uniref:patatin-like phospholipase family protein n=1 Tax=Chitinimonas sp. BJB300 TaxID=1559339 RepID=UPI000C0D2F0B|nr:patatin-like phospholipase family protein [Chitinimonas sp. BJB300]PHV09689.1 patatin [Chitinimonas sp. BJB300]TSJ87041.1 patatin family protein [Chitinimonas sp. BJB300]
MPRSKRKSSQPCIGLNLAAGGPLGAIYEVGALCALEEALQGIEFTDLDIYVGISAGGFIAAALANQITPREMYEIFITSRSKTTPFEPDQFLRPAYREYLKRILTIPELLMDAFWAFATHPQEIGLTGAFMQLAHAIPTGLFDNSEIDRFLSRVFTSEGRTNDFRALRHKLYIVATDLDTGRSVKFGGIGHDHVSISKAVQASSALPGLFPPVEIDGDHYVDGALKKTLHASISLDEEADLVICLNPIVPFDSRVSPYGQSNTRDKLMQGGLPVVLSQTFRSIIHSRMRVGMQRYAHSHSDIDILLFEPSHGDKEIFFSNVFSYADRENMCEHAYQHTRADLRLRAAELEPTLARHGITINYAALNEERYLSSKAHKLYLRKHAIPLLQPNASLNQLYATLATLEQWLACQR